MATKPKKKLSADAPLEDEGTDAIIRAAQDKVESMHEEDLEDYTAPTDDSGVSVGDQAADAAGDDDDSTPLADADGGNESAAAADDGETDDPLLDKPVPKSRLNGYLKQQAQLLGRDITYRDLMEFQNRANDKITELGKKANDSEALARVLSAQTEVLREMAANNRPRETPAAPFGYDDLNVDPNTEIQRNPAGFGEATADIAVRRAQQAIAPEIENLKQTVNTLLTQNQQMQLREVMRETHEKLLADGFDLPLERFQRTVPYTYAAVGLDKRGPLSSDAWYEKTKEHLEAFGAKPKPKDPAPRRQIPADAIVRGNPHGSSRLAPVRAGTALPRKIRGVVDDARRTNIAAGMPVEMANQIAAATEEKLQRAERAGEDK